MASSPTSVPGAASGGVLSKVPAVTVGFWIIKVAATTLGETAGDTATMTMDLGYLTGTVIFLTVLAVLVVVQTAAKKFHPFLYWGTIVASTTAGTTMADFADRSLGIGYSGGSSILLACVLAALGLWYWSVGTVSVESVNTPKVEFFFGRQSRSPKRSGLHWATGQPTPAVSVTQAERSSSEQRSSRSLPFTIGPTSRAWCCSGWPSS